MCPTDPHAYFGPPAPWVDDYEEIHISVTFTWDLPKLPLLTETWRPFGKVIIGGPAINGESDQPFQAGRYLKQGITITSRGCPNNCSFCMVRHGLIEFDDFPEGNIIQDNNVLACSDKHWRLVLSMLKKQKGIEFKGGLEKYRITPKVAEDLRGLSIKTLWLACDQPQGVEPLRKAVTILKKAGFTQNHIYCYVLIGDDRAENENRLKEVYNMGAMPFAQLFKDPAGVKEYSKDWKQFARLWSRPALYRKKMKVESCLI